MFYLKKIEKRGLIQVLSNTFSQSKPAIPIIDLEGLKKGGLKDKQKIGQQIDEANTKIGFFLVKNTGIEMDFIQQSLNASEQFFTSSIENKMKYRIDDIPEYKPWGYFPRNRQLLIRGKQHDQKEKSVYLNDVNESFNIQNDNPKAKLPSRILPIEPLSFASVMSKYWKLNQELSNLLLKGFAYALELPENYFQDKFDYCGSALRLLHYPETVKLQPGQFRASEHTDYGALTVLYSTAPGLQVKNTQGQWIDVQIPKGHFVINIGDLMSFWTNKRWVSTPHRVVAKNRENPTKRSSLVFFHNPNYDAKVECIASCRSKQNPVEFSHMLAGDFIMKKFKASIGEAEFSLA